MTIRISGNTFDYRQEFKDFGGRWNADLKCWTLPAGTNVSRWRGKPGLVIQGADAPNQPKADNPSPELRQPVVDDFWDKLIRGELERPPHVDGDRPPSVHGNDITYLNAFTPKNPPFFAGFQSFSDMVDFVEAIPDSVRHDPRSERKTAWNDGNREWFGSRDMEHALDLARNGWHEGVELASEASEIIAGDHATQRIRKHTIAGGRVNVGRMLSGNPLHMVSRPRQDGRKVITLFVQIFMSSAITAENAIIRAASVAAISDVLSAAGYSCEIVAVQTTLMSSRSTKLGAQIATVIKQAGEALNIENIAFALGHPSMFRRLVFAITAVDECLQSYWRTQGGPLDAFEPDDLPPGSFYIPKLHMQDQKLVQGDTFKDRVRSLFPLIVPEGLPISLE